MLEANVVHKFCFIQGFEIASITLKYLSVTLVVFDFQVSLQFVKSDGFEITMVA